MSDTQSISETVNEIMRYCLFKEDEVSGDTPPDHGVEVQGVARNFVFHPKRLEEKNEEIQKLVEIIPSEQFLRGKGGGMTFLNLAETKNGDRWGEHPDMEAFCVLAIVAGYGSWMPLPSEMLPGNMPYIVFDPGGFGEDEINKEWN